MSEKKEYVKLWLSYGSYFESYNPEEIGNLVLAMLSYKDSGKEPEFQGAERFIWPAIKRDINEARLAQEAAAEQSRENGRRGGRPRKTAGEEENPSGFSETQETARTKDMEKGQGHCQGQGQVREGTAPLPAGSAGTRRRTAGRRKERDLSREIQQDILRMRAYSETLKSQADASGAPRGDGFF